VDARMGTHVVAASAGETMLIDELRTSTAEVGTVGNGVVHGAGEWSRTAPGTVEHPASPRQLRTVHLARSDGRGTLCSSARPRQLTGKIRSRP